MRTCAATPEHDGGHVWLSCLQKLLCEGHWDELPDGMPVAVVRLETLRRLWSCHASAAKRNLFFFAEQTTVGAIRTKGKKCEKEDPSLKELSSKKAVKKDFKAADQLRYLSEFCVGNLPIDSYRRLACYARGTSQHLFGNTKTVSSNASNSAGDRVLEGSFTDHFRAGEILVALRLGKLRPVPCESRTCSHAEGG